MGRGNVPPRTGAVALLEEDWSWRPPERVPKTRTDVQGLRAVAVLLVVLDHVFGKPRGGFVGVDIFFVISGFLITGILIRERETSGRTSIRGFYARRARRILPMAIVVLVATNLVARWLFLSVRAHQSFVDSLWAAVFLANEHFASIGTSYFDATRPASPVQHFWSLAVEEQFYVVWPLAILVACLLLRRDKARNPRVIVAVLAVVMIVVSFAFSVFYTDHNPTGAYFSAGTRGWELGVGALTAALYPRLMRVDHRLRLAGVWLGGIGMVASAFVISPATPFPGYAALLPVVATAMILGLGPVAGGVGERWALGAAPWQTIGDISYSLYLWHWPAVIFANAYFGKTTGSADVTAVVAAFGLSFLSYHLIEDPIRHSYLPWQKSRRDRRRFSEWVQDNPRIAIPAAAVLIVALLAWGTAVTKTEPVTELDAAADVGAVTTGGGPSTTAAPLDPLAASVRDSLAASSWGALDPSLDSLANAGAPEWLKDKCLDTDKDNLRKCVYGSATAPHLAVLMGDSLAISYLPGLRLALGGQWRIQSLTMPRCPQIETQVRFSPSSSGPFQACDEHNAWAKQQVNALSPELVIVVNRPETFMRMLNAPSNASGANVTRWRNATAATATALGAPTRKVVFLGGPPPTGNLQECATRNAKPSNCARPVAASWFYIRDAEKAAAESAGAIYADPLAWFCFNKQCPAVIGNTPVHWDGLHMTAQYARNLAPQLAVALRL